MKLTVELGPFPSGETQASVIRDMGARLITRNREILSNHKHIPMLYNSGIRYVYNGGQLADILVVMAYGYADCGSIPLWRVAELQHTGEDKRAAPMYSWKPLPDGRMLFHCRVRRGNSEIEDPCLAMGMRKPWTWD